MKSPKLENLGSLITYKHEGRDVCLGYLVDFTGKGVFDPTFGRVEVTKERADIHNKLLDEALIAGLDTGCEVGQWGTFYFGTVDGKPAVTTFMGVCVTTDVRKAGSVITFKRHGKTYRGREQKDADCFNFKRVS